MKSVTLPFRESIRLKLNNVIYLGQRIPVYSEYAHQPGVVLNIGNGKQARAWIQLTNDTADDFSPKCLRVDQASIQIQVRVSYSANSGGYEATEKISDIVMEAFFPDQNSFDLTLEAPFKLLQLRKESDRNLNFQDDTDRVWMKNILLTARISQ